MQCVCVYCSQGGELQLYRALRARVRGGHWGDCPPPPRGGAAEATLFCASYTGAWQATHHNESAAPVQHTTCATLGMSRDDGDDSGVARCDAASSAGAPR